MYRHLPVVLSVLVATGVSACGSSTPNLTNCATGSRRAVGSRATAGTAAGVLVWKDGYVLTDSAGTLSDGTAVKNATVNGDTQFDIQVVRR